LPEFAEDSPVEVLLRDAITDSTSAVWKANIIRTEGELDENSRDLFAVARIIDPFGRESGHPPLRIGQPVEASIRGQILRNVIPLPQGAVRQLDKIVLVDKQDRTLTPLEIEAIWSDAKHVVVDSADIPEGQLLATSHLVYAPAGAKVEIIPNPDPQPSLADTQAGRKDGPVSQ
ncbi:MAG: efflux RND transporter periplasmic adaptor subunit, partial [Planctomycetota bacterium]